MDSVLELQRRLHEQIDSLEAHASTALANAPRTQRPRLKTEHYVRNILDKIAATSKHLLKLYDNYSCDSETYVIRGLRANGEGDFSVFYAHLMEIKDYYRRVGAERDEAVVEYEAILRECRLKDDVFAAMFSGEEGYGRYLDLIELHGRWVNLVKQPIEYAAYLDSVDSFAAVPRELRQSRDYGLYVGHLLEYLLGFFKRARPLFDLEEVREEEKASFEERWLQRRVRGWEFLHREESSSCFCGPCDRQFANEAVYRAHFSGRRHIKAAASRGARPAACDERFKHVAAGESLVQRLLEILADIREDTKSNVERKAILSLEERRDEEEEENDAGNAEPDAKKPRLDEDRIYNPLKLPLDWDGKPIPYWLWKLHGLGIKYACEVCGNYDYMGRKAFDQHFYEWRHANAMKCLGIPNTRQFFQITRIEDAQKLWEQIKTTTRAEKFKPEAMEEFEDQYGNVYNRKTYEDLQKQGLI